MRTKFFFLTLVLLAAVSCREYDPDSVLGDSRVRLELGNNEIKGSWKTGETVTVFAMNGSEPVTSYIFTASSNGRSSEFSCPTDIAETSDYRFVYPASSNISVSSDGIHATIPVIQTATEGRIGSEVAFLSGASRDVAGKVELSPLVSYVRFVLLGGAAENVRSVTISAQATLSGSIAFHDAATLRSVFNDVPADGANPAGYVSLEGRFTSGGTYYAAVLPGAENKTFQVTAEDASGNVRTVEIEGVSLRQGEIADLGTVYLGPALAEEGDIFPLMKATKGLKPVVLMFIPDGFTEGRGAGTREEYIKACREGAAYIFNVEPFRSNREYFTVYAAWKAAPEAGLGTTFGTSIGLWYNDYMGLSNAVRRNICDFAQSLCPEILDGTIRPAELGMFLIVNGRENYGAVCEWVESNPENEGRFIALVDYTGDYQWSESLPVGVVPAQWGGNTSAGPIEARTDENGETYTYTLTENDLRDLGYVNYKGSSWGYLGTWKNTLLHEGAGHGFGRLQDEYWFSTTHYARTKIDGQEKNPRQGMNLSASMEDYPWKNLMSLRDELIQRDPRYARIGMFQGGLASYFSGIWRAEQVGAMNDMRPYFGTWNRALIYERIMHLSGERPDFDVVNNMEDLKTFLEADIATGGNYDPMRDNTAK